VFTFFGGIAMSKPVYVICTCDCCGIKDRIAMTEEQYLFSIGEPYFCDTCQQAADNYIQTAIDAQYDAWAEQDEAEYEAQEEIARHYEQLMERRASRSEAWQCYG
jgi:hypothetical protein